MEEGFGVATTMAVILGTMVVMVGGLISIQDPLTKDTKDKTTVQEGRYLPCPTTEPSRLAYEQFVSVYTPIWMCLFGLVVVTQVYEQFTAWSYLQVCGGLSLPFLLQPIVLATASITLG